ncbi:MAG: fibronectin type III domain-containing protein [Terriglobia bacterium]
MQGPPHPPRIEQPTAVKDLAVAQRGRTIELTFTLPELATDGERLSKPLEVEILRAVFPPAQPGPPVSSALGPWKTLAAEELSRIKKEDKAVFPFVFSPDEFRKERGATLAFGVRTLTRRFRRRAVESDLSNIVQVILVDVPAAVTDLKARTEEHALALNWCAPAQTVTGQAATNLSAYCIYRSSTGKPGSFAIRGEVSSAEFRDLDFEFGRTYLYRVTAVAKQDGSVAESEESPAVEITPRDVFPPAVPRGLNAVYTTDAVELIWTANSEPDLAGYNVYRREEGGEERKINQEILRTPIVRDTTVAPGRKYIYRVTAIDLANNESARSEEAPVETH